MSVAVKCSNEKFRNLRSHLDEMGVQHKYYLRKAPSEVTTFYLEVSPLTKSALQIIKNYAKENRITVDIEIDHELYNLTEGDLNELLKKAKETQKNGLVRGYHY